MSVNSYGTGLSVSPNLMIITFVQFVVFIKSWQTVEFESYKDIFPHFVR
jgi:hypothetical protein